MAPAMEASMSALAGRWRKPLGWPIRGGSDDPIYLVEAALKASPVCGTCLAIRTHLPAHDVEIALKALVRIGAIHLDAQSCDSCHRPGAFSKFRPAS